MLFKKNRPTKLAKILAHVRALLAAQTTKEKLTQQLSSSPNHKNFTVSLPLVSDYSNLVPGIIIGLDVDCNIVHLNHAAEQFLGCNALEVIGKPLQLVIVDLAASLALIQQTLQQLQPQTLEKIKISHNNTERFIKIIAYPFSNTGITLYIDDISERVAMENILLQTEKLTTLGTLAAGMAHEINNALSGVLQSVQNISRRIDPNNEKNIAIAKEHGVALADVQKYLETRGIIAFLAGIRELGEHSSAVVKNVLKFSRRSEGVMILVDVNSLVQDTLSIVTTDYTIKKQIKDNRLIIRPELATEKLQVNCVPSEIEQVLINLIRNAAQAVAEKTFSNEVATIVIKINKQDDLLQIAIADNGPGIAEHLRPNLFKPFFTTKPEGVGTGLGLSISHYIVVDKHHGKIVLESVVGKGTTFTIELPL